MNVYLLRHGDAADRAPDGSMRDEARELTPGGITKLKAACTTYARILDGAPVILHSPLIRARQTADILCTAVGGAAMREVAELRPSGRPARVIDLLQGELLSGIASIAVVGHEPLLGDLLGMLSTGLDRLSLPMGKGMLAAIRFGRAQVMVGRMTTLLSQEAAGRLT